MQYSFQSVKKILKKEDYLQGEEFVFFKLCPLYSVNILNNRKKQQETAQRLFFSFLFLRFGIKFFFDCLSVSFFKFYLEGSPSHSGDLLRWCLIGLAVRKSHLLASH